MDAGSVPLTTYLGSESVRPYAEDLVQRDDVHPMDAIARSFKEFGIADKRIGFESDTYFFSFKAVERLQHGLPTAAWIDADRLVNWCRVLKSDVEIHTMRQAARIASHVMSVACDHIAPGVRQCDLVAKVLAAQVSGVDGLGGDLASICPLILAGEAAATAHPLWTDEPFTANQTVALELGGARKRYNAGLARTVQLGQGTQKVYDTAAAVKEGLEAVLDCIRPGISAGEVHRAWQGVEAVLDCIRPGISAGEVHRAWQGVLDRHGLVKESRIGYSIGVGYAPDWGEHTVSLRANEETVLEPNMTLHVMLGMWMDGWGIELSETVAVTETGVECLTQFDRDLFSVR